jgi:hypothetical protein
VGRTETARQITNEPWSSMLGPKNTTNEDAHRSERRSALINSLTEPTLLEMSGNATNQDLTAWSVDNFRFADHTSK